MSLEGTGHRLGPISDGHALLSNRSRRPTDCSFVDLHRIGLTHPWLEQVRYLVGVVRLFCEPALITEVNLDRADLTNNLWIRSLSQGINGDNPVGKSACVVVPS